MPKPLDMPRFYILLALAMRPMHGYAVSEQVMSDSQNALCFRLGNLYRLLHDMTRCGLIEVVGDGGSEGVRIVYRLTKLGRQRLRLEAGPLREAVKLAAERVS